MGTNFTEILVEIHAFSFKKMHLKMSSGKWRPFCLGLNVLTPVTPSEWGTRDFVRRLTVILNVGVFIWRNQHGRLALVANAMGPLHIAFFTVQSKECAHGFVVYFGYDFVSGGFMWILYSGVAPLPMKYPIKDEGDTNTNTSGRFY